MLEKTTFSPTLFNLQILCIETIGKSFTDLKVKQESKTKSIGNNFNLRR
jgi:hypothetical protein